jgi:exosortase
MLTGSASDQIIKDFKLPFITTGILLVIIYWRIVPAMVSQWQSDPNYSHGFLVPFISAYFLWQNRQELSSQPIIPSNFGLLVVGLGLILLIGGYAGTEYFSMRISMIVLVAGIILYWFGWPIFKCVSLPLGFLVFMIPLPYIVYNAMAFPLKLFIAKYSVMTLEGLGMVVWREGNIIMLPQTVLQVADACSGLRSLVSLMALGVAFAFIYLDSPARKALLIVSTIPIAIITNMLRVIVTAYLAIYFGASVAEGFFHEFAGLAVFGLAMALIFLNGTILKRIKR